MSKITARDILNFIQHLDATGISMDSGNCGTFALAIAELLRDSCSIVILSNAEEEEDLTRGEPDVYHVVLQYLGYYFDVTGKTDVDQIFAIAERQYNNFQRKDDFR